MRLVFEEPTGRKQLQVAEVMAATRSEVAALALRGHQLGVAEVVGARLVTVAMRGHH
jgi:hypothetical protein